MWENVPKTWPPSLSELYEILTGDTVLYTVPLSTMPSPPSETIVAPNTAEVLVILETVVFDNTAATVPEVFPVAVGAKAVK